MGSVKRLKATEKALELIKELEAEHGPLMFYQAGGCCEGTQPMCFTKGGYYPRLNDVCIGQISGFDFWIDRDLFEYWKNAQFELDVLDGFGTGGFSLEIPKGKTFKVNYTIFTPEELDQLEEVKKYEH
ncbi:DUF779 domain-containing protein [Myroides ceti]|uniref:DUF779 domain-containing protein n=1 Tax=Paenimyroides ceti TaxID=395087 RepID=A0ABT8CXP2_9FLAO|nr:DUF779 domain-containing protein [Paenimyroides ceti]MDN3708312.1 DUF779 domain-containing protein [Paenimyroides ceti]